MSKLKDALESAISTLQREAPRIQNILDAWESYGPVNSVEREELDRLKDKYENGTLMQQAASELAFCEDNDEEITRLEDQEYGRLLRKATSSFESYADQLRAKVDGLESRASEHGGTGLFGDNYKAFHVQFALIDGSIPYYGQIESALNRALKRESSYARSPEQLLKDMTEDSREDEDDTRLFCSLFDFKTMIDGFETHAVVPPDDADIPQYIGGEFSVNEYDRSKPENFVWVAFNQLGDLCEEYNDAYSSDLSEDEKVELREHVKQEARPIMYRVVDETHEKYGAYRDRIIASVQKKQDEYELSDDAVSAFANRVTKSINSLIKNVENEFSEETQFSGGDWGVLRVY